MNKNQISGKVDQAVGKVKQNVGAAVGNQKLANNGVVDQVKGAIKETWGNVKETAGEIARDNQKRAEGRGNDMREHISHANGNVKDRVHAKIDAAGEAHQAEEEHRLA